MLESFRLPPEQSLDLAAEYGIDGVQIYARNQRLTTRTRDELRDFAKLFSSRNLEVAAVCGDLGGHGFRSLSDNEARIAETFRIYPDIGQVLPGMGYGDEQVHDLEKTINAVPCDLVVSATPIDITRLVNVKHPIVRVGYELEERPGQKVTLAAMVKQAVGK